MDGGGGGGGGWWCSKANCGEWMSEKGDRVVRAGRKLDDDDGPTDNSVSA